MVFQGANACKEVKFMVVKLNNLLKRFCSKSLVK
jgi:hypothetical protein